MGAKGEAGSGEDEQKEAVASFPFRPWVRSSCRKAMTWGLGVVALLALVSWFFRTPGSFHLGRAFGVLLAYSLLFWVSLAKIWWTAGKPAVQLGPGWLAYQSVLYFRPTRIPLDRCVFCGPREGTQSQRIVYREPSGRPRELFLNLGIVKGRAAFLRQLGAQLEAAGLSPRLGRKHTWSEHGWTDEVE